MDNSLKSELINCPSLPSIPAVAAQIIEISNDDAATLIDIANCISIDPALAVKILRCANSPMYRRVTGSPCDSIQSAVMALGLNKSIMITLSFSIISDLNSRSANALDLEIFWRRSLLSATVGWVLAVNTNTIDNPDTIFLACLLQDIGILALNETFKDMYEGAGDIQKYHSDLIVHELEKIHTDHAEVGAWLLAEWKLPHSICSGVLHSHSSEFLDIETSNLNLARCVSLSGLIADLCVQVEPGETSSDICHYENGNSNILVDVLIKANSFWNIDTQWLDTILHETLKMAPEFENLFGLKFSNHTTLSKLKETAKELALKFDT
jgi:HD-like signal output (HDOD) protein